MKKLWKKIKGKDRSGESSPKSGSTRGSLASLNICYDVKEKDLGKLHKAAWNGDLEKVKQLVRKDPSPLDKEKRTPLHLACVRGHDFVVQLLLEWKAKANIGDSQSRTPLMRAVECQQEGCVKLLLNEHVDIDTVDLQGLTPLHLAVESGNTTIIKDLIKAGASLNIKDKEGLGPLHLAVSSKQFEVCELLLKEKADVNLEDNNLRTPLILACHDGSIPIVKLLLEYKADASHKDAKGWSADDHAVIQGHHACCQLISDRALAKRPSSTSTPRSISQPGSSLSTPRDKGFMGLPVADGGAGDDSDNETISKASGAPGSDSWADSPDVSTGEDLKRAKKDKDDSDIDEMFEDDKIANSAPKISLAKFAKNIHISESDTDGESVRGSTPKRKMSVIDNPMDQIKDQPQVAVTTKPENTRQTSWQSQTSGEENSWGDSPVTPRKNNSAQRVSFKKDEELSEIHNITAAEESDVDSNIYATVNKSLKTRVTTSTPAKAKEDEDDGYMPTGVAPPLPPSLDKMRGEQKTALMEELGISDVDDISEISEGVEQPPPLPASPPPKAATSNPNLAGNDWDSSVLSDITTPRPGILKNWNNTGLGDSGEEVKMAPTVLLQAPAVDSGDDNSDWDTTETTQNAVPQIKPSLQSPRGKDSVSEWDSELEDMADPANSSNFVQPSSSFTQKTTAVNVKEGEWGMIVGHNSKPNGHLYLYEDHEDNPTHVAVQPGAEFDIEPTHPALTGEFVVDRGQREEDSNSDWDSEADEQSMENEPPAYMVGESSLPQNPSSPVHKQAKGQSDQQQTSNSEDESESMSSWEVERKKQKHVSLNSPARQRELEEEARRQEQEDLERLYREQQEEMVRKEKEGERIRLEEQMRIQREEEVRIQKQKEEEEIQRIRKEEEDLRKKQREDEERIKKLKEEEGMLKRRKEEEEKIQKQREAEDKLKQQREEEEKMRKLKEEEEEKMRKQKEEEEKIRKHEEEQKMRKEKEEEEKIKYQKELIQIGVELDENETQDWEVEERQEILDRQWEIEEGKKEEQLKRNVEEVMERQSLGKAEAQEMIFFQSVKDLDQSEQRRGLMETFNEKSFPRDDRVEEGGKRILTSPPFKPPPPPKPIVGVKSPGTSPYAGGGPTSNIVGGSTVEQIKQRLQVPQMTSTGSSSYASPNMFSVDPYDDNESQLSDNPGDERPSLPTSYYQGMYRHNDALDDDALSYTSTEFEDQVHSTPSYGKDREVLTNINLSDPSSLIKVQEYVRETRRQLEQEKNQRFVLENKLKVATKEKTEVHKKLESINREKSNLEQARLDLEAKIRSLEYSLTDEEEKRKNAQILLSKTKEQLDRKETQYASELESKQKMELTMRNLQIEIRTASNTIKELMEEKEELERKVSQANNSHHLQEKLWEDQKKLISHLQEHTPREQESSSLESTRESFVETDKLQAELYAVKMEMDRQRSRFKDNIAMFEGENEILNAKVDELRNEIKLNEEALVQASQMYSLQLTSLKSELNSAHSVVEKEKSAREKLEAEIESLKTRLLSASHEMDKAISARNELEREHRREKELWSKEMERKSGEVTALKDDNQHLNQRLHATEGRLNTIENELHVSNTSLMERTAQLQQLKQELDRHKSTHESLDQNYRLEKENNAKLQAKVENMQDKVSAQQQDNFSLRQQLDSLKLNVGSSPGSDANEKLSNILASLRADSDRAKATLEEKNNNLVEQVARLKEEVRGAETKRVTLEQDLKRLQDEHNTLIKKLSQTEASLQIAVRAKEQAEQERIQLKSEVERLQQKYQSTHDKSVESQARISELVDRLEKAEHTSLYSNQQLANTSANMQGLTKTKTQLDESMQQMQIENAKLEAELKYEKQRADMLYQDLQDSQKVRSSLEALCANLKSSSAHIEDRLGSENGYEDSRLEEEIAARVMYEAEARDHKNLYDLEMKSRSKLCLRIADLERNKYSSDAKLGEEKNRAQMADEKLRYLESQLEAEKEKNHQLQKDMNSLKHHLKSAKNKIKETREFSPLDPQYTEFQKDVSSKEIFVSTPRNQSQGSANIGDMRSELEAKYRMELNRKLDDVNRFLESQSQMRDRLDTSRTDLETSLMFDKRKLEEENNNLRVKYEQALAQRETKEMEAKRFRELYESEMKWRLRVSDQLTLATEKSFNLKSKLNNERHHRSRITGSIGNLNSSVVSNGFDITRVNGFEDDDLSNKIKAELDRSIAKHLEAAPHDLKKPVFRTTKDAPRFSSSLAQSSNDYFDILKRKYCV